MEFNWFDMEARCTASCSIPYVYPSSDGGLDPRLKSGTSTYYALSAEPPAEPAEPAEKGLKLFHFRS